MPSATEPNRPPLARLERWNRKLHYYAGLYFLLFLWLFALSGLVLNHPNWNFHEHWKNRHETTLDFPIKPPPPAATTDLDQAHDLMRQLAITGDILWTVPHTDPAVFEFQVRKPSHFYFIKADFKKTTATVRHADVNTWGLMKFLHVFSGNVADDPRNKRDWPLTYVWAYSMDAVAAGLIFMVLSSLYMTWQLPQKRFPAIAALVLGCLSCGLFCLGLRWIF